MNKKRQGTYATYKDSGADISVVARATGPCIGRRCSTRRPRPPQRPPHSSSPVERLDASEAVERRTHIVSSLVRLGALLVFGGLLYVGLQRWLVYVKCIYAELVPLA